MHRIVSTSVLLISGAAAFLIGAALELSNEGQQAAESKPAPIAFQARIAFGYGEAPQDRWQGSIRAEDSLISGITGWLLLKDDHISAGAFELHTMRDSKGRKVADVKGVVVAGISGPRGRLHLKTQRGDFSFAIADLSPAKELPFLDGKVRVNGMRDVEKLTDDTRDDDYPSIAVADENTAWAVWQSYSGRADEIRLAEFSGRWHTFTRMPGASPDVWRPQVAVDSKKHPWIVWSQQLDGNFDLYARPLDPGNNRWLNPLRLSSDPLPDIDHHLISDSHGHLWVVWQGFRGTNSDIFLRHYDGTRWSEEIRVTDDAANDWEPRVAVNDQDKAYIVWDSYRGGNYNVYLRTYHQGLLGDEMAIADTSKFEAHPSVAVDTQRRVWVAWDEAAPGWGKDTGFTLDPRWLEQSRAAIDDWHNYPGSPGARIYESRKINLLVLDGNQRKTPIQDLGDVLGKAGTRNHDYPQLISDPSSGRMALLFHRWEVSGNTASVGYRALMWEQALLFYEGNRWSSVHTFPESSGRPSLRAEGAFGPDSSLWMVWPTDGRSHTRPANSPIGNVYAARIDCSQPAARPELRSRPETSAASLLAAHPHEATDVAEIRAYRTSIHGIENRIVRGDLHRHTEFSWDTNGNVDGSIFDYYRYMLDAATMDFGGITDHNSGGDYEYAWWLIEKTCDMYMIPGAFTTLYGYERSVNYPAGHRNIFHTRRGVPVVSFFTRGDYQYIRPGIGAEAEWLVENDTQLLYESLRRTGGISIPHTSGSDMGTDWRDNDPDLEPVVEIFQGDRVSYETPGGPRAPRSAEDKPVGGYREAGFVWNAYRKGYRLGTIASSDHWSTHISYAMVFTEQPTREAIFDGIRSRHTYGATDNIILDCRMGPHFMGEAFSASEVPPLELKVFGTGPIARVEVIRNEKVVFVSEPDRKEVVLSYKDRDPEPGCSYYYVRVTQKDGQIAWGSPIWISPESRWAGR